MNLKNLITKYFSNEEYGFEDIIDYFRAKYRSFLYNFKDKNNVYCLRKFISSHIISIYKYRLAIMKKECLNNYICVKCGCETPELQFCNKSCSGACYPPMVSKKEWLDFINMKKGIIDRKNDRYWLLSFNKEEPHKKILKYINNYSKTKN